MCWFINLIAGTVSSKWKEAIVANGTNQDESYGKLISPSDEAYGLMIISQHRDKWVCSKSDKDSEATRRAKEKKKKDNASRGNKKKEHMVYYCEALKEMRKNRADWMETGTFAVGEAWVKSKQREEGTERRVRQKTSNDKNDDDGEAVVLDMDQQDDDNPDMLIEL